jgi:hypothetical protein
MTEPRASFSDGIRSWGATLAYSPPTAICVVEVVPAAIGVYTVRHGLLRTEHPQSAVAVVLVVATVGGAASSIIRAVRGG